MADILQRLRYNHEKENLYHQLHDLKIVSLSDGYAEVYMPARPEVLNPMGNFHGGAIFTLCDVAAGTAAASRGKLAVTLSSSISYMRPGYCNEGLLAKTTEMKYGHTTAVYSVDIYQGDRLVANGQFTMYFTGQEITGII